MTNDQTKDLCLRLLQSDHEEEVIDILTQAGFWTNRSAWRLFGDNENNYSTIGNQQAKPEAALVEKLVNAVDARLMLECQLRGINPEGPKAPKSIRQAVAVFLENHPRPEDPLAGRISEWNDSKRREVAQTITFAATGARAANGNPCFTITDKGEGQTPERMPDTLLSLNKSNKLRIPFVQGKFNMGGTGVLKFCGKQNLQLVISRRNPDIANRHLADDSDLQWGFTVVRREEPEGNRRSSVFTYLAPVNSDYRPSNGGVLRFTSDTLPLFPDGNDAYVRPTEWGTLIKLYEYHAIGARGHILLPDGMLSRIDLLLPEVALPVRLHECRKDWGGKGGHAGSWETTMNGLIVRITDNKRDKLEFPPLHSRIKAAGEEMLATIYAFKEKQAKPYRKNEGILFTLNGQTHGAFPKSFFSRRTAGSLDYIADDLMVIVDCTDFSGRAREDFIMNSRDRLSGGELRQEIEHALEDLLKNSDQLRALRERRQREATERKLDDQRPLEDILSEVLKQSPTLSQLFLKGTRLSDPFRHGKGTPETTPFHGKTHPTFWKFREKDYGTPVQRNTPINMRSRLFFETDAVDDYFGRDVNKGEFEIFLLHDEQRTPVESYVGPYLFEGQATVSMKLPLNCQVGDELHFVTLMTDPFRDEPFENRFSVTVREAQESRSGGKTSRKRHEPSKDEEGDAPTGISLPNVIPVFREEWEKYEFTKHTAVIIKRSSADNGDPTKDVYDFYVNMDNLYLQNELKLAGDDANVARAQFKFGMVLAGMGIIHQHQQDERQRGPGEEAEEDAFENDLPKKVAYFTQAVAPVLVPTIRSLADIRPDIPRVEDDAGEAA
jgi:hypothetical protein